MCAAGSRRVPAVCLRKHFLDEVLLQLRRTAAQAARETLPRHHRCAAPTPPDERPPANLRCAPAGGAGPRRNCPSGAALDQRRACPFVELQVRHADFGHRLAHAQRAQRQRGSWRVMITRCRGHSPGAPAGGRAGPGWMANRCADSRRARAPGVRAALPDRCSDCRREWPARAAARHSRQARVSAQAAGKTLRSAATK
jgi:hypothetical protein